LWHLTGQIRFGNGMEELPWSANGPRFGFNRSNAVEGAPIFLVHLVVSIFFKINS
jgi:hypothetical protein